MRKQNNRRGRRSIDSYFVERYFAIYSYKEQILRALPERGYSIKKHGYVRISVFSGVGHARYKGDKNTTGYLMFVGVNLDTWSIKIDVVS